MVISIFILFKTPDLNSNNLKSNPDLTVFAGGVIHQVIKRMINPDPWFDRQTLVNLKNDFLGGVSESP